MAEFQQTVIRGFQRQRPGTSESGPPTGEFDQDDPIRLWIIQVGVIICTASLLSLGLRKIHQPKVIAEVLGGIILGPTVFGRIPGFTSHVFPESSRAYLGLVANIGLCLFLFLVGLEIDLSALKRNARLSVYIALAGMVLPFALGTALSAALYNQFIDETVKFEHFMLFTGVAYSITAFPVLCRILTELKLLDTTVGVVVLSAGVGNDIVGWILLALSVALVNAGSGLAALYIFLVCIAWTIIVLFPIRCGLRWLARTTGSIENGPTVFFMTVTMLILFGSAFFTDVIGVHAIFGAFLAGLIVPREGGLAISLTEKLEDMVSIIFLPLYFTLSGLSTDLGLLDSGKVWAYTLAIICTAFLGKFGGCSIAARYAAGFGWREAGAIGGLMSCKGLVELIVLNVGLSAGILSQRVFSMFVLEALVLTFMTTPLVTWIYPPGMRVRVDASGAGAAFKNIDDGESDVGDRRLGDGVKRTRFMVVLDKFEHLAGIMAVTELLSPSPIPAHLFPDKPTRSPPSLVREKTQASSSSQPSSRFSSAIDGGVGGTWPNTKGGKVSIEALRLMELSDRVSAVMKSSVSSAILSSDPLLSAFRMFGALNGVRIHPSLAIVQFDQFAGSIAERAREYGTEMVLIPWLRVGRDGYVGGSMSTGEGANARGVGRPQTPGLGNEHLANTEGPSPAGLISVGLGSAGPFSAGLLSSGLPTTPKTLPSPFEMLFKSSASSSGGIYKPGPHSESQQASSASVMHSSFVRSVFGVCGATVDVGVFVDLGMVDALGGGGHDGGDDEYEGAHRGGNGDNFRGDNSRVTGKKHLFLPFFGGPDDRLALEFVVQLCESGAVRATVVRIHRREDFGEEEGDARAYGEQGFDGGLRSAGLDNALTISSHVPGYPDTVYSGTQADRLQSDTADNVLWAKYTQPPVASSVYSNIHFKEVVTLSPLRMAIQEARCLVHGGPSPAHEGVDGESGIRSKDREEREGEVDSDESKQSMPVDNDQSHSIEIHVQKPSDAGHRSRDTDDDNTQQTDTGYDTAKHSDAPQDTHSRLTPQLYMHNAPNLSIPSGPLVILTGRSRRLAVEDHRAELKGVMEECEYQLGVEVRKAIGDVASGFVVEGVGSGILVVQAGGGGGEVD